MVTSAEFGHWEPEVQVAPLLRTSKAAYAVRVGLAWLGTSIVICVGLTERRGAAMPFTRTRVLNSVVGSGYPAAWAVPVARFDPNSVTISCGATGFVAGAKLAAFTMPSGLRKTSDGFAGW